VRFSLRHESEPATVSTTVLRQTEGFLRCLVDLLQVDLPIIDRSMRSRTFDGQGVEVRLACKILNTTTLLGMPDSYRVA